jgi:hypothetical protein
MFGPSHNQPPSHLDELSEVLRLGVEGVRRSPPPADRQKRALEAVRRLAPPEPRPRLRPWMVLSAIAVLALGMVAYGLRDARFSWTTPASEERIDSTEVDLRRQSQRPSLIDVDVVPMPPRIEIISGRRSAGGPYFLHASIRPTVALWPRPGPLPAHAVFLLDSSSGTRPASFDLRVKLLQAILESAPEITAFNVLVLGPRPAWVAPANWLRNTSENRSGTALQLAAVPRPPSIDLNNAWRPLAELPFPLAQGDPTHAFLLAGDGLHNPSAEGADLAECWKAPGGRRVVCSCYGTVPGEAIGRLLEALAGHEGGPYGCFRDSDLTPAAMAYQQECFRLTSARFIHGPAASEVRTEAPWARLGPGGVLRLGGQFEEKGPTTLVIEGTIQDKKVALELPVEVREDDPAAPGAFSELPLREGPRSR